MKAHECFHCKQWIEAGAAHDCWTTTEAALTRGLPEDLRDAWERLRETAVAFGEQRIYASHHSIMFSRKTCYFFVRPQAKRLELCIFLGRTIRSPLVKKALPSSLAKVAHIVHVVHRDQVEAPLTDWLREAYEVSPTLVGRTPKPGSAAKKTTSTVTKKTAGKTVRQTAARKS
jgi:hypothetical protein